MADINGQPATDLQVSDVIHKTYEKVRLSTSCLTSSLLAARAQ